MKQVIAVLVAAALVGLAGCGNVTNSVSQSSPSSTRNSTTYANRAQHFAITYDPATFQVRERTIADQVQLRLRARDFTGGVMLQAIPMSRQYVSQALAVWHHGKLGTSAGHAAAFGYWTTATAGAARAQWVTFNGERGVRALFHKGAQESVLYWLMQGQDVYALSASAPAAQWTTDAATLAPVLQSFRLTK